MIPEMDWMTYRTINENLIFLFIIRSEILNQPGNVFFKRAEFAVNIIEEKKQVWMEILLKLYGLSTKTQNIEIY